MKGALQKLILQALVAGHPPKPKVQEFVDHRVNNLLRHVRRHLMPIDVDQDGRAASMIVDLTIARLVGADPLPGMDDANQNFPVEQVEPALPFRNKGNDGALIQSAAGFGLHPRE